jgi:uncharacterized protein
LETQVPHFAPDQQVLQGYRAGGFTVSGVRYGGSILVFPDRTLPWSVHGLAEIDLAGLDALRTARPTPDILIVGTGAEFALFPPALRQAIRAWGPVVEAMATPAACRTYNVLLAEERRVAAALMALPPES